MDRGRRGFLRGDWPRVERVARIGENCLVARRVVCRTCGEICEPGAIHFTLGAGGIATPGVTAGQCNGCGACAGACPVGAMALVRREKADLS